MKEFKSFINGEFISSTKHILSLNPANAESIASVSLPTEKQIDEAVDAAHNAFYSAEWKNFTQEKRVDLLLKISELIKTRKSELIEWEIKDSGSSLRKATADINNAATYFKILAAQLKNFSFKHLDPQASREGFSKNYKIFEPVGVCAQIIPWNFPLVMAAWKIGPVIASGSTCVIKSAQETPITAFILAEILKDAGLPKGVVNVITGSAFEGEYLIKNPKIRKIAFTGSTEVGKKIMELASKQLKRVSLELGGKSANIVLEDADLDLAVDGALYAFLYHSGQACDSGTRLLVHEKIYEPFKKLLLERIKNVSVGDPQDPKTGYGPVINQNQFNRVIEFIQKTKNEKAPLLYGGERLVGGVYDKAYYIKPTVFEITSKNTIFHEEIFGPVVGLMSFKTNEEAISIANNSRYGLAGAIWSKNTDKAIEMAQKIETGTIWINEYHLLNAGMPFGGYKESGIGREMGEEGLKAYLEVKHLWVSDCNERSKKPWLDAIF